MRNPTPMRLRKPSEEGYILVAVMFMLAILMIALAVAAPSIAKSIQRDRELETMRRGKQYIRGIKMYYKKFGAYPPNVDALVKTNEIRFLRKKYIDPTTGKDEWKIIHLGQNKVPTAYGFFGVPLTGAGAGGGLCGNALPSSTGSGSSGSSFGSSGSTFGSSGSSFGSSGSSFGSSGSSFGTSSPTQPCPTDTSSSGSGSSAGGSTDQSSNNGSTDQNNANGGTTSGTADGSNNGSSSPTGTAGTGNSTNNGTNNGTGLNGQSFGGGGIMGFSPNSPRQSILFYKKKNHYNEWEFVYDPIADQMMMQGGNIGGNGLNPSNPTGSSTTFGGSTIGGSTFGGNGNNGGSTSGSSGSTGGTGNPTTPQQ